VRWSLPHLDLLPRALEDIEDCLRFIGGFPRGRVDDRERDIVRGIGEVLSSPKRRRAEARRANSGVELRRHYVAQFAIVYAWFEPNAEFPNGVVSIRAVRHRRVRNVFLGVKDSAAPDQLTSSGLVLEDSPREWFQAGTTVSFMPKASSNLRTVS